MLIGASIATQGITPTKSKDVDPGTALVAEWNAVNSQIDQGRQSFTVSLYGVTKNFTVNSHGDKVKTHGAGMKYSTIEVQEEQAGKADTRATTTFTVGSADGINNFLLYDRKPANGGQKAEVPIDFSGMIMMPSDQIPKNIWP